MIDKIKDYLAKNNVNPVLVDHTELLKELVKITRKSLLDKVNIESDLYKFLTDTTIIDHDGNVRIIPPVKTMGNGFTFQTERGYFLAGDRFIKSIATKTITELYDLTSDDEHNYVVEYMKKDFIYDLYQVEWSEKTSFHRTDILTFKEALQTVDLNEPLLSDNLYPNFVNIVRNNDLDTATIMIKANKRLPYVLYSHLDTDSIEELKLPFSIYNLVEKLKTNNDLKLASSLFKTDSLSDTPLSSKDSDIEKLHESINKVENSLARNRLNELFKERYVTSSYQKKLGDNGYSVISLIGFIAWLATIMLSVAGIVYIRMM